MSLFFNGQKCAICGQAMAGDQPLFGTWGVWLPQDDPLWEFCDATMHWACYAEWPHRERFASSYFQFWTTEEEGDVYWHRAFLDDDVLVTVNPSEPIRSAWVHLRDTGSRLPVKLNDWEKWIASDETGVDQHAVLSGAVQQAKAALRSAVPTVAVLEAEINQPRKWAVVEAYRAAERLRKHQAREVQRQIQPHNAACNRLMKQIERGGLTCRHCETHSKDYRISRRKGHKSAVICTSCGWVVDPPPPLPHGGQRG